MQPALPFFYVDGILGCVFRSSRVPSPPRLKRRRSEAFSLDFLSYLPLRNLGACCLLQRNTSQIINDGVFETPFWHAASVAVQANIEAVCAFGHSGLARARSAHEVDLTD